ncbi:MAG: hypothetical protein EPN21_07010 [Methylococcaceae bacterium]|nr:MAG: hypothetical protein EPN21_07010 [Methylococcaceae bacterium]
MSDTSSKYAWPIALALAGLLAVTRSHHYADIHHLPDATWAIFFLAAVYLRPVWILPLLLAEAAAVDYVSIVWDDVSSFCVSPAYGLLVPAYGVLWLAGRWYGRRHVFGWDALLPLNAGVLAGAALCELLSGGGFYWLSGRFGETSLLELGSRLVRYFPLSLSAMAFYLGLAVTVHVVLTVAAGRRVITGVAKR